MDNKPQEDPDEPLEALDYYEAIRGECLRSGADDELGQDLTSMESLLE